MLNFGNLKFYQNTIKATMRFLGCEEGPVAAEYAVMLSIVIGGMIVVIIAFKASILSLLTKAADALLNMNK